ncbi:MAG: tetratricopeptide repeat protein [Sphingobacteriales bacterium]|nr:MAG: tetratricopeptide repeat protein [Sphingobacteriales bacterium]
MKRTILSLLTIACITATYAQKSEITNAKNSYGMYEIGLQTKAEMAKQLANLEAAKAATDKAIVNEKTKENAELWAYRGLIFSAITATDTINKANAETAFIGAQEAIAKAKTLDVKADTKAIIASAENNLSVMMQNKGLAAFNAKNYKEAYTAFKYIATVLPQDSTFNLYTAIAANSANMYDEAIVYYNKLLVINPSNASAYRELGRVYLTKLDTTTALKTFEMGSAKHPNDINLIFDALNIYLNRGQAAQKIGNIENAISKDTTNKTLRFVAGIAYSANKQLDKAEAAYLKAIALDANYQESYFNLGVLYINKGNDFITAANKLPNTKAGQTKYEALKKSFDSQLAKAEPYLEKALDLNPKDVNTMNTLKEIYVKLGKLDKATALKKKIAQM